VVNRCELINCFFLFFYVLIFLDDECRFPDEIRFSVKIHGLADTGLNGQPIPPRGSKASALGNDKKMIIIVCIYFLLNSFVFVT